LGAGLTWFLRAQAVAVARRAETDARRRADELRKQLRQLDDELAASLNTLASSLSQLGMQAERSLSMRVSADDALNTGLRAVSEGKSATSSVSIDAAETSGAELEHHGRAIAKALGELERRAEVITNILQTATGEDRMAEHKGDDLISAADEAVQAASAMDEVIRNLQTTATDTADLSTQVSTEAERGYRAVHRTLDQIESIRELTGVARARIEALGERVSDIGHVVKVIQDITEKTNLLALNASIIAAQAGEHGRSFAVVANEIKALAQRTAASTKEISEQIRSVQQESERATSAMVDGVSAVGEGFQVAIAAGDALDAIRQAARRAQKRVQSMSRTLRKQMSSAQQVVDSAAVVSDRAASFAAAVRGQSSLAEQLRSSAVEVQDSANQIRDLIRDHGDKSSNTSALLNRAAAQLELLVRNDQEIRARLDTLRTNADAARNLGDDLAAHWGAVNEAATELKAHTARLRTELGA